MTDENFEIRDGTVLEAGPEQLLVRMDKDVEECGGCRSCAIKSLCHDRAAAHLDVRVAVPPGGEAKKPGDRVRVAYRRANAALASLILFLPTLVGLCAGGFVANRLFGEGDGIFLAGVAAGVAAGLLVTFLMGKLSKATVPELWLADNEAAQPSPLG